MEVRLQSRLLYCAVKTAFPKIKTAQLILRNGLRFIPGKKNPLTTTLAADFIVNLLL